VSFLDQISLHSFHFRRVYLLAGYLLAGYLLAIGKMLLVKILSIWLILKD